ncbi:C4-dicarboxylate ABC transporter permease [Roseibium polysiphoniae]|uniref:TRAP transporter large permease protein n=1 Tax=Roseibium polysiphoniae TaxID=2571221 RepID=A0A944CJ79_9HYPH|nr:TRAP transporter large permease subunit [Roseibium polysiphoniae]MBS8262773.1 C4-dicarboxylate ABC transporter permease [Roseibium polysiphoniae]
MDALISGFTVLVLILLFLGSGVWVFVGLLLVSTTGLALVLDFPPHRIGVILSKILFRSASSWELAAIPLFIWMGEIIFRTNISSRLFEGLAPFVSRLPGGLIHTNVAGSTLFAAVSGSSAATTATVGKITTVELKRRGYDESLSLGSLAGAGSLGLLIPPSIVMIIYGVLAEVSITRLFAAGILPGLLVAGLYSAYILVRCAMTPGLEPPKDTQLVSKRRALLDLLPVLLLVGLVLGAIYSGLATPSEAAAVGVLGTLVLATLLRQMSLGLLCDSLMGAVRASAMVCSILVAAAFLSTAMGYMHVPQDVASLIAAADIGPYGLIALLALFYIVLGFFLDGISIVVMSLPITLPPIIAMGFDPIWFGVFLVLMVELGQMTPPVGFNLFVIQGLTGVPIGRVARAAFPFFLLMAFGVAIVTIWPQIVLWLPSALFD